MKSICMLLVWAMACAGATLAPRIEYSKYFKGSVPEYVEIAIDQSGQAVYKEAKDDDQPLRFQLQPDQVSQIFSLSDKLDHFTRPLESQLKVAHMGIKTFRFDDGKTQGEVKFNYSEDPSAQQLADWFERITETEQAYINLERTVKFDKLGVQDALLQVLLTQEKKRLIAPEQFLPLLDRVTRNESYMHIARDRAANLADAIRKPAPSKSDK